VGGSLVVGWSPDQSTDGIYESGTTAIPEDWNGRETVPEREAA
jgi:hypothetical protein